MPISFHSGSIGTTFFCLGLLLSASQASGQEYSRSFAVKEDSVTQQISTLATYLQRAISTSSELRREYRDSLYVSLRRADTSFKAGNALQPAKLATRLPHPAIKTISDLAWNDFLLAPNRRSSSSLLPILAANYPAESFIQGNLIMALELDGSLDSAIIVAGKFLARYPNGFTPINIDKNLLFYKSGSLTRPSEIINLGADSFKIWVQDKLYKYPAPVDSLRNALAAVISQRAGASKAPDEILGQLILDYGDLSAREKIYRPALEYYDLATFYDPALKEKVEVRVAVIRELEKSVASTFTWASIIFAVPLLAFVIIIVGWIRRRS